MDVKGRRRSAPLVISILALVVALAGTALAAGGVFNQAETKAIKKISRAETAKRVIKVFEVLDQSNVAHRVLRTGGFQLRVVCAQDGVRAYIYDNANGAVDGSSDVAGAFAGQDLLLADDQAPDNGFRVSSFSIATENGKVWSGNLGFDYPGAQGIFSGDTDHCVVHGHIVVN